MWYIIWILVSATLFGVALESDKCWWLGLPSGLSCITGITLGIFALATHFAVLSPKDEDTCQECNSCERLAEYKELERQGLLVKLPCKVGDKIYLVDFEENDYDEATVISIEIDTKYGGIIINSDCEVGTYAEDRYVFYTKEGAERALKQKKGE